jgi:hypothetical protein
MFFPIFPAFLFKFLNAARSVGGAGNTPPRGGLQSGRSPATVHGSPRPVETEIKDSLARLLGAVARSDGATLQAEMLRLEGLLEKGRGSLPAQLQHFLERRSYAKAFAYLGGKTNEAQGAH